MRSRLLFLALSVGITGCASDSPPPAAQSSATSSATIESRQFESLPEETQELYREVQVLEQDGVVKIISGMMDVPAEEVAGPARDHVGVNVTLTVPLSEGSGGGVTVLFFREGMDQLVKRFLVDGRSLRSVSEMGNIFIGPLEAIPAIAGADSIGASLGALRVLRFTPAQTERLREMAQIALERGAPAAVSDPSDIFY